MKMSFYNHEQSMGFTAQADQCRRWMVLIPFMAMCFLAYGQKPSCGDGVCNGNENESTCPDDCGSSGGGGECTAAPEAIDPYQAPLYWSTYELQVIDLDPQGYMKESEFSANVDWVEQNLLPYGYELIWMDGGGGDQTIDNLNENGYLLSHSKDWTNDFDWWSCELQSRGMKLGMYENPLWVHMDAVNAGYKVVGTDIPLSQIINPDEETTWFTWVQVDSVGAEQYVKGYVQHWADMGIRYLNADFLSWYEDGFDKNMGTVGPNRPHEDYVTVMTWIKEACDANGMHFKAVMPHLNNEAEVEKVYSHAIRINEDVGDGTWGRFSEDDRGVRRDWWSQWANPMDGYAYWSYLTGRDNLVLDGDFIRLNTMANDTEKKTVISQHLMAGGPIGVSDRHNTIGQDVWLYQNSELLALNQDGFVGKPLSSDPTNVNSQIWKGQMANGDWIVGFFNREESAQTRSIDFASDLGMTTNGDVRDLWAHSDVAVNVAKFSASIPAHGSMVIKVVPTSGGDGDTTPPAAPANLTATAAGPSQIDLDWDDNAESDLSAYNVYSSTTSGGPYNLVATAGASNYSHTGLNGSTTYYYVVTAEDNSGNESDNSNEASATTDGCGALPAPFVNGDVGAVSAAGSACYEGGIFTVEGSGADIESSADEFHYVYYQVDGDVTLTAKVESVEQTDPWAKAGVMIRETLNADSKNAMTAITGSSGAIFQRRETTGGATSGSVNSGASAPYWIRIQRQGNTLSGYVSSNNKRWTQLGSNVTLSMASTVYVGLAVTSHNDGTLCTSTFSNVSVETASGTSNFRSAEVLEVDDRLPELLIYPNPANNRVSVSSHTPFHAMHIVDPSGRVVRKINLVEGKTTSFDVSSLVPGLYFMVGTRDDGSELAQKLVIK